MKLAKRALVLLLTLAMLVGCIPAFGVAAKDAVVEGAPADSTTVITSYEQIYVKDGLILLSTVYGNEGDGNISLANGVWNNRVGDADIAIVGSAREVGGYNGWWLGDGNKGVGYNYSNTTNFNNNKHTWGMRLPCSLLDDSDMAVEYVYDYVGIDEVNTTNTGLDGWGLRDGSHASFSFNGLFITQFHASIGTNASGMETRLHYGNVPFETKPTTRWSCGVNGGAGVYVQIWPMAKDESSSATLECRTQIKDEIFTLTINRNWAPKGEHTLNGKTSGTKLLEDEAANSGTYTYVGYTVDMNGVFKAAIANDRFVAYRTTRTYAGTEGVENISTNYYTADEINEEGQKQSGKYTAFDAFFGFPATVYAVRVYDRQISSAESAQNHFADTVAWFGNAAIDLATYSALSDMGKANVHGELATVAFNTTTADAVNAVIAKWAAKEIATTVYDDMYVQDGLVLLTSAFGNDASLDLASGVWYNKIEDGTVNVKINGTWTALDAGKGGIGYTATAGASHPNNYLSFDGVVDSTEDFTVEYFAKLQGAGSYGGSLTTQKFGDWGDWYFQANSFRIVYNYAGLHSSWLNGLGWYSACSYVDTDVASTSANVIKNTASASYRTAYVNAVADGAMNGLNIIGQTDSKKALIEKNEETQPTFFIARSLSSEVYAVRAYDRALSQAEVKYNAAVDACAFYGVDVSAVKGYSAEVLMVTSFANAAGMTDAASIAAVVATAATEAPAVASACVYNELYVQDGLNLLLLAYNGSVAYANVATGTWINLAGVDNAKIVDTSSDVSWTANSAANGGGITYKFASITEHQNNRGKLGLTLPANTIGDDDFTVETVFVPHYVGDGTTIIPHSNNEPASTWGAYHGSHSNFTFGNIHLAFFQPSIYFNTANGNRYTGSSAVFRFMTCDGSGHEAGDKTFCKYLQTYLLGKYDAVTDGTHNVTVSDKTSEADSTVIDKLVKDTMVKEATSFVVTRDVNDDKSFTAKATSPVATYSLSYGAEYYAANADCTIPFDMFYTFAATVYAIRAYDRVLTDVELAQNKAVDALAKAGADVSALLEMDNSARAVILTLCANDLSYTMTKEDADAVLAAAIANTFIPDTSVDAYSALYVQNGLSALYTAFDGGEKTVDLENGIWYATGSEQFITLNGNKWEQSNGGIGYRMSKEEWSNSSSSDYIALGALASNDFTVEISQTMVGLTDAEGNRISVDGNVDTSHTWGYYATEYSAYEFGNFKGTAFVCYVTTAGIGNLCTRVSFNPGHWGTDNGRYWIGGSYSWADETYATVPSTYAYTQASGLYSREVPIYNYASKNHATEEIPYAAIAGVTHKDTNVPAYALNVYENGKTVVNANTLTSSYSGQSQYNREVTYKDELGETQTGYIGYLSAAEAGASVVGKPMKVMNSMPGDVYAIRVYNRAISAEEAAWNSLVDIAAYVKADVSALAGLSELQKLTVGAVAANAGLTYASTKEEVETVIAHVLVDCDSFAPVALGYQKGTDGTSLRIWATASIDAVLYADMLGMVITVSGDAEKTLSGETERVFLSVRSGDKIVCPELEDTYYFAAVLDGIPADGSYTFTITPYAVVDGLKIYGDSVVLTWPTVE